MDLQDVLHIQKKKKISALKKVLREQDQNHTRIIHVCIMRDK